MNKAKPQIYGKKKYLEKQFLWSEKKTNFEIGPLF